MRYPLRVPASVFLLAVLAIMPAFASRAAAQGAEVLTNESVVQMIAGKVPKDIMTSKIRTTKSTFDVTSSGLISLASSKVPNDIIKLMMTTAASTPASKETLSNDAIVRMVNGQVSRDIIIAKIQMSKPDYDLTTSGLINLNQNKVSQEVVKAMMASSSGAPSKP